MKSAGFDWLFIDLEHGALSIETASQMCLAGLDAGISPLVRIPNGEFSLATRLLDNGALGIVVPHVETAEEAVTIVDRLRYPPHGHRGVFSAMPQFDYKPTADMTASLNKSNLIAVMLESARAIANAEAIAAVSGIDVLLIGTNDLCVEMAVPGELGHAKVVDAYARMIAACRKHAKWPGMGGIYDDKLMQRYIDMGVRFVLAGGDLGFLMDGAAKRAALLRKIQT
jgi:2-keto-3-deoxy-L-rhamnonate aldolase RhmA